MFSMLKNARKTVANNEAATQPPSFTTFSFVRGMTKKSKRGGLSSILWLKVLNSSFASRNCVFSRSVTAKRRFLVFECLWALQPLEMPLVTALWQSATVMKTLVIAIRMKSPNRNRTLRRAKKVRSEANWVGWFSLVVARVYFSSSTKLARFARSPVPSLNVATKNAAHQHRNRRDYADYWCNFEGTYVEDIHPITARLYEVIVIFEGKDLFDRIQFKFLWNE